MNKELASDPAALARHKRFGELPERIGFDRMTEEKQAEPIAGAIDRYNPEGSWNHFSCLALDLGL